MKPKGKQLIYSTFEINSILFYATMMMFIPIILVFTSIFDLDTIVDINKFIFICVLVNFGMMALGTFVLVFKKDHLKRIVKPTYQKEYIYLVILSIFGVLGFVVFYDYMGGNRDYIANILVFVFALLVYLLIFLGRKFFKFDYMKKK
ncbi:MAG: hypothetical protein AB7U79_01995 [Candidatus Izemoplasmatales bacterium]